MPHRYMTGGYIKNHFWYEEGIETRSAIAFGEISYFFLEGDQAADTTCKYNAYSIYIKICFGYTCIFYCFVACCQCSLCKAIEFTCFFFIEVVERIKIL